MPSLIVSASTTVLILLLGKTLQKASAANYFLLSVFLAFYLDILGSVQVLKGEQLSRKMALTQ